MNRTRTLQLGLIFCILLWVIILALVPELPEQDSSIELPTLVQPTNADDLDSADSEIAIVASTSQTAGVRQDNSTSVGEDSSQEPGSEPITVPDSTDATTIPSPVIITSEPEIATTQQSLPTTQLGSRSNPDSQGDANLNSNPPLPTPMLQTEDKEPDIPKVSNDLADLVEEYQAEPADGGGDFVTSNVIMPLDKDMVSIDAIPVDDPHQLLADLQALGLQQGAVASNLVSGWLPIASVPELALVDSLRFVRPAYFISNTGGVLSQGDAAMRADLARTTYSVDGSGIMVGTLSDSYACNPAGAAADVSSGDLPAGVVVLEDSCPGGTDEGRGMMQLIYDVAPGSSLAFHTADGGQANFASGIIDLANVGADVIVDDIIYLAEPMFQDGVVAQAIDTVVAQGIPYFSSAGNSARQSYESAFRSSGTTVLFAGGDAHDFDPGPGVDLYQDIRIPTGTSISIILQWDQPFFSVSGAPGSANDLDIAIMNDAQTTILASSANGNVGGDPVEIVQYFNPNPIASFKLVIEKYTPAGGPDPGLLKYVYFTNGSVAINQFHTLSATSYGHANAAGAEAVGAAFYGDTPPFGVNPPLLESFSSAGGIPILFDIFGNSIYDLRQKPEIVAPDGGNTTFFGTDIGFDPDAFPNFFGTSAAAPHAAGVAALMLEANAALTPAQIYSALENSAIDIGVAGFDNDSGYGLIDADAAVGQIHICTLVTDIPQSECEALYDLYASTNGPSWTDNTGWLSSTIVCNGGWYGVICDFSLTTVEHLQLAENNLSGTLPDSISDLTNMWFLQLHGNSLTGSIPAVLGSMPNLDTIALGDNNLTGGIPVELTTSNSLEIIYLYSNPLGGTIPPEFGTGNISNTLAGLILYDTGLTGTIPVELANIGALDVLILSNNNLNGSIPSVLGNLANLRWLELHGNNLTGSIPTSFGNLSSLEVLTLSDNQLNGSIPTEIGNITTLESFLLRNNAFSGEIPTSITNLINLGTDDHISPAAWHPYEDEVDFGYNALYSTNGAVTTFLNGKDADWADTQTVAPINLATQNETLTSIEVTWDAITYTADGGYYEISHSTSSGGPYTVHGTTADKTATNYNVTGLNVGTPYYFLIRTFTPAHGDQKNDLWSDYSAEFTGSTEPFPTADLGVVKSDTVDPVIVGNPVTYTVTVMNNGPESAENVVMTDDFPLGMIFNSATPDQGSCGWDEPSRTITCTIGTLSNGANANITIIGTPVINETLFNEVSVWGDVTDTNAGNDSDIEETVIDPLPGTRMITFAGQNWYVKDSGTAQVGPGPNYFDGSNDSVWVDQDGKLHLTIRNVGGKWVASEIYSVARTSFGMHRFFVETPMQDLDENVVFGMFLYQDDEHEIDVEIARWGDPFAQNAQFVVQPYFTAGNRDRFFLNYTGKTLHEIDWSNGNIDFRSVEGHDPVTGNVIHSWSNSGANVPHEDRQLRVRLNLWLLNPPQMPADAQEVEIIITSVEAPQSVPSADLSVVKVDTPDPIYPTQELTYDLTVTNHGGSPASNVILTDTLPVQTTFVSAVPDQGNCNHNTGTVTCNLGTIMNGETVDVQIKANVNGGMNGYIYNTASVAATEPDPISNNDTTVAQTTVLGSLDTPVANAAALSEIQIQVTWTDATPDEIIDDYEIEQSPDGSSWTWLAEVPGNVNSYVHQNLLCNTTYHYRVRSVREYDGITSGWGTDNTITPVCPTPVTHYAGLYKAGVWKFRNANSTGGADVAFLFGPTEPGWQPLVGDWDGDGKDGIGLYKDGIFFLRNATEIGGTDSAFAFGPLEAGWTAITGDWDADGVTTVGVYKEGVFRLRNSNDSGVPDEQFLFGPQESGWSPIAGDWNMSGNETVGIYRDGQFMLHNSFENATTLRGFQYGPQTPGWIAIGGDWDKDGYTTIGLYDEGVWRLRNANTSGATDIGFNFGDRADGWTPLATYHGGVGGIVLLSLQPQMSMAAPGDDPILPDPVLEATATPTATNISAPESTEEPTAVPTEASTSAPEGTEEPVAVPTEADPTLEATATEISLPSPTATILPTATAIPPTEAEVPTAETTAEVEE